MSAGRSPLFPASGPGLAAGPCGATRARRAGARRASGCREVLTGSALAFGKEDRGPRGAARRVASGRVTPLFPAFGPGLAAGPSGAIRARRAGARRAAQRPNGAHATIASFGSDHAGPAATPEEARP